MANLLRITNKIEPLGVWGDIPSNSINSVVINFEFSEDWQDLICVAQFTQGEKTYNQIIENNRCLLPSELTTGNVIISVFATKSDGTAFRETSIPFCFEIFNSGFSSTAETPVPPTPDLYEQLIEKFSKNVVNSLNGKTGAVEIVPDGGIDVETTEDGKIKIKSTVSISIDTSMSDTSENPVQNKVVTKALEEQKTALEQYADNKIDEISNDITAVLNEDVLPLIAQKLDTIEGGTISGNVEFTGDVVIANAPTVPSAAVNKEYADSLKTTVDTSMSDTSENPVQNKVVKQYIDSSLPTSEMGKLIYRAELSEDVSGVAISTDSDNNRLALDETLIIVNIPASSTLNALSYLACQLYVKSDKAAMTAFNTSTVVSGGTANKYWQIVITAKMANSGWFYTEGTAKDVTLNQKLQSGTVGRIGFLQTPNVTSYNDLLISKIVLAPTGASGGRILPIGTIIEVYGINKIDDVMIVDEE